MVGNAALVKNLDVGHCASQYTLHYRHHPADAADLYRHHDLGSKLWIRIAGFTIQPGEFAKVFIVLFLAGYLAENRELLSISNRKILGFKLRFRLCCCRCLPCGVCAAHRRLRTRPKFGRAVLHHLLA